MIACHFAKSGKDGSNLKISCIPEYLLCLFGGCMYPFSIIARNSLLFFNYQLIYSLLVDAGANEKHSSDGSKSVPAKI